MFFLFYTLFAWPLIFCEGGGVTEWLRSTPWWVHPMAPSALSCLLFSVLHIRWTFPFLSFPVILVIWISPSLFITLYGLLHLCSSFLGFSSQGYFLLVHHPIYSMLVCNKRHSIRVDPELEPNRRTGTQPAGWPVAGWVGLSFSTGRSRPVFYRLNTQKKMAFFGDFHCKSDVDNLF